ncbi:MAG: hydantoinase B/oxoprolinase family protein, partial [Deltaproteobacteria bacterium]|nr:hydantoinase B/oxoprolinase family protein [Deltaproteobacteria bacterium]
LFSSKLSAIAEEMGEMLQRTALSTNVKERRDFSCAILDASGELVVNAPHIPVHLGSLGVCVREVTRALPLSADDVAITNHPAFGGSHLPDITLVAPVHHEGRLLGYVANRAHHAEIGGKSPGSFPTDAASLLEEGVVIAPRHLVRANEVLWQDIQTLLEAPPYPSRAVEENLADLNAALAALRHGQRELRGLAQQEGQAALEEQMARLKGLAARQAQEALRHRANALGLAPGHTRHCHHTLDDGTPLAVTLRFRQDGVDVDFTGTGGVHPGSLNATPAIVQSAVLYVLRLLLRRPLPLNEGLLQPVHLTIPEGLLAPRFGDDPAHAPAVVGGNVETSQRLVGCLLEALGMQAGSQGTMNNVIFGDANFGYYETLGGGVGASATAAGASAVHSHMTNTAITDVELLEMRHPVRIDRFALRQGSGGVGRLKGGEGIIREFTFLAPLQLSLLTQHRNLGPRGLQGGSPGLPGRQTLFTAGGEERELPAIAGCAVGPGDRLRVETPGGGGYGATS